MKIAEGTSLKTGFLDCSGTLQVLGTLTAQYDIDCSDGLDLQSSGVINLGRRLILSHLDDQRHIVNLAGTINFTHTDGPNDSLNCVNFIYNASTLDSLTEYIGKAAADSRELYKYSIYLKSSAPLTLLDRLDIPANTNLSIQPKSFSGPALTVAESGKISNSGMLSIGFHSSPCNMQVNGTLSNELGGIISIDSGSSLTVNGTLNNKSYVTVDGRLTVNGSLVNDPGVNDSKHFANISVERMNDEQGVLTLGSGGTYSGYGSIGSTYPSGEDYKRFIIGFESYASYIHVYALPDGSQGFSLNIPRPFVPVFAKVSSASLTDGTTITPSGSLVIVKPEMRVTADTEGYAAVNIALYGEGGRMLGFRENGYLSLKAGPNTYSTGSASYFPDISLDSVKSIQVFLMNDDSQPLCGAMRKTLP